MKRKLNTKGKILIIILSIIVLLIILFLSLFIAYKINIGKVSNNTDIIEIEITKGDSYYSIASSLKEKNLIKSELFYKVYIKLSKPDSLKAGTYSLSQNMSVEDIVKLFSVGVPKRGEMITFKEGLNMSQIASLIASKTNNKEEDVYEVLKDEEYIDSLIEKYWFITDDIKNNDIYYSLEGYLFPETYEFYVDSVTVKEIFNTMINQTGKRLEPYKNEIISSKYSVHEILTLASIIELEGKLAQDRKDIAGVFYNRLNSGMSLGSDVTTYYGAKVNMSDRDLYVSEINDVNAYNTRSSALAGKLPVGPISNPSITSIVAALSPNTNDYYYFVADKYGKTYFSKNYSEHNRTIASLKEQNLWYTY
ncbi:MAG: endolytic transglycosylase MltG [Clostridium sp.]|nr:endolytic transglycosylase MltG [Clostridium sp.]MCM1444121.1 endolytic transglycosylase MltG [Candidatus Amulumruptor caecigallinarius]